MKPQEPIVEKGTPDGLRCRRRTRRYGCGDTIKLGGLQVGRRQDRPGQLQQHRTSHRRNVTSNHKEKQ